MKWTKYMKQQFWDRYHLAMKSWFLSRGCYRGEPWDCRLTALTASGLQCRERNSSGAHQAPSYKDGVGSRELRWPELGGGSTCTERTWETYASPPQLVRNYPWPEKEPSRRSEGQCLVLTQDLGYCLSPPARLIHGALGREEKPPPPRWALLQ